jgi:magnesium transporter
MTDAPEKTEVASDEGEAGRLYGIDPAIIRRFTAAIEAVDSTTIEALLEPLHASDVADLLEELTSEQRSVFLDTVRDRIDPETLTYLDEAVLEDVLDKLAPKDVAAAITELDTDDALNVIVDLEREDQEAVLR